jgi:predicted TIM-barrel fold metal-dependent hydrolase
MIVDVHSHAWRFPDDFSESFIAQAKRARAGMEVDLRVRYDDYRASAPADTKTIVFGGKAKLSGTWVDDRYVADYVAAHPENLIGFLCVDPTQDGWQREMEFGYQELGLRGIKLLSMYAGFRPDESRLDPLWTYATKHKLPVLLHTGTTFIAQAPLECTLPRHLDTVAIRFPEVKIIMAHLGHPYEGECIVTIRKHPNVYADISALHYRPFQLYHSLMLVQEYGVWNKVLFGTDYPFTTVNATIEGLHKLNDMTKGTGLPKLSEKAIEEMIYRDSLTVLGLNK